MADDSTNVQIYDPPPLDPQLTTAAMLTSLPPQVLTEPPQTVSPLPAISSTATPAPAIDDGLVKNTNPPAVDANDVLLFDPDEQVNYDVLGATPGLTPLQQGDTNLPVSPVITGKEPHETGIIIDLDATNNNKKSETPAGETGGLGWKFWIIIIVVLIIISILSLLYFSSTRGTVVASPDAGGSGMMMPGMMDYGGGMGSGMMGVGGGVGGVGGSPGFGAGY